MLSRIDIIQLPTSRPLIALHPLPGRRVLFPSFTPLAIIHTHTHTHTIIHTHVHQKLSVRSTVPDTPETRQGTIQLRLASRPSKLAWLHLLHAPPHSSHAVCPVELPASPCRRRCPHPDDGDDDDLRSVASTPQASRQPPSLWPSPLLVCSPSALEPASDLRDSVGPAGWPGPVGWARPSDLPGPADWLGPADILPDTLVAGRETTPPPVWTWSLGP